MNTKKNTAQQIARSKNQGSKWIRKDKRLAIYLRDGMACAYCGHTHEDGAILTLDHVRPVNKNGGNGERNLVTACLSCNSARGDKTVRTFATDQGLNADAIAKKVRKHTRRSLTAWRKVAKQIIANR